VGTRGAGEAARTRRSWEFSATCSLARLLLPSLARSLARSLAFSTIATLLAVIGAKCAIIVPRRVQAEPTRTDGRTGERMDSRWTLDIARATCVWEVAQGSWNPERIHDRGTQDGKSGAVARPNSDLPVDLIAPRSRAMDTRSGKLSGRTATTTLVPANINDDARAPARPPTRPSVSLFVRSDGRTGIVRGTKASESPLAVYLAEAPRLLSRDSFADEQSGVAE